MIFLILVLSSTLCLLPLISDTAFEAIISIGTIGVQVSYAIPIFFRVTHSKNTFKQSKFKLGDKSIYFGWISVIWLSFTSFLLLLPNKINPEKGITGDIFNYCPIVVGFMILIALVNWNLPNPYGAKYFFRGPRRAGENLKL